MRLLVTLLAIAYLLFAWQLSDLMRRGRYGEFLLRLILAPVILLFDWPIDRRRWRQ